MHGIPVEINWHGRFGALGEVEIAFPGIKGSYPKLIEWIDGLRNTYPAGMAETFDQKYAQMIIDLAVPGKHVPDSLVSLEHDLFGSAPGNGGDVFRQRAAAHMMLSINLEGARGLGAHLTNLMVWNLVAKGHVTLDHALTYLNVMGPDGSAQFGKVDELFNWKLRFQPSDAQGTTATEIGKYLSGAGAGERLADLLKSFPEVAQKSPGLVGSESNLSKFVWRLAPLYVQQRVIEFEIRQREIIALYAVKNDLVEPIPGESLAAALNRHFYGTREFTNEGFQDIAELRMRDLVDKLMKNLGWSHDQW